MPPTLSTLAVALVMAAALLSSGCFIGYGSADFEEIREIELPHVEGQALDVETTNGRIDVRRGDVDRVLIKATLRCTSEARLAETAVVSELVDGKTLRLTVSWPNGKRKGNERCAFDVTVPGVSATAVKTSNGRIELTGLSGPARVRTSNGRITVDGHDGELDLATSNGRITVRDAAGRVKASTSNGRIEVTLAGDNPGPVQATTSNGRIALTVGAGFRGELRAKTSNGKIKVRAGDAAIVEKSKRSARVRFGQGGADSSLVTSNGSITIKR